MRFFTNSSRILDPTINIITHEQDFLKFLVLMP